jgi:hypothetical protein
VKVTFQIVGLAFDPPYLSRNEGSHPYGLYSAPALQTAMRLDSEIQKIIDRGFLLVQAGHFFVI